MYSNEYVLLLLRQLSVSYRAMRPRDPACSHEYYAREASTAALILTREGDSP